MSKKTPSVVHSCVRHLSCKVGKANVYLLSHRITCVKERKIMVLNVLPQKEIKSCRCNIGNQLSFLRVWWSSNLRLCFSPRAKKQNVKLSPLVLLLAKEEEKIFLKSWYTWELTSSVFSGEITVQEIKL